MSGLFVDPQFWIGLGEIIVVNIILSGDNAVVIALAARSLPEQQRNLAIVWGSVAAILMRVVLTIVAVEMLRLPYLKIIGSVLLFWIAVQLLLPEGDGGEGVDDHDNLIAAIRTILIADLVMSLDNVIAVAAAAKGNVLLLILGLAISIPLVIFGSTVILRLMDRFPVIIVLGAALLGFVSGEMLVTDPAWPGPEGHWLHDVIPFVGAVLVVLAGKWLAQRKATTVPHRVVDLAAEDEQPKSGKTG
ncbi:TerC family protein [Methylocaldum sp. RMAD-M]|jgi:YjbE family integral membrane protein|uniref:TerC family protein n=1 Tax=Methylocaldum sp. RMAD-M TaxID=2806557 RepID=UPI000A328772|nr:TerC family protein [Methylocaldum sp. RMAD-M]MBP1149932.1 YjbE family integral membrane protein [Methylocaldum sp. RMAD-M]MVF21133.1 TerC family protein [Methylocaldum sp. BRCS4]